MLAKLLFNRYTANAANICKCAHKFQSNTLFLKQQAFQNAFQGIRKTTTQAVPKKVEWFSDVTPTARRAVGMWLIGCAGMCFGAVVIGGITRLTESGLSMTQWHLIKDMKPPRTDEEWQAEFERYKQFPEYQYLHSDLTVEGFKNIFFWEYVHRMWGRAVGLFYLIPAVGFYMKGWITKPMVPRLGIYFVLIGCQGLLGWYMVKSGLTPKPGANDVPRVSQYRLAAHLSSALVLYSLFLWSGLTHLLKPRHIVERASLISLRRFAHGTMGLIFLTAVSGAFVAGLDAGLVYNTWPKFADRWVPSDLLAMSPKWKNMTENTSTVQFNHRHLAYFTAVAVILLGYRVRAARVHPRAQLASECLVVMVCAQIALGIATLLSQVHLHAAATHQAGSVALLSFAIWLVRELKHIPK